MNILRPEARLEAYDALRTFEPVEVIRWDTGRTYTKHGQRIGACLTPYGVAFYDYDRMIGGLIPESEDTRPESIMWAYDRFQFSEGIPSQLQTHLSPLA
jgi:hypothetical protein